jgi:hypothetical protein
MNQNRMDIPREQDASPARVQPYNKHPGNDILPHTQRDKASRLPHARHSNIYLAKRSTDSRIHIGPSKAVPGGATWDLWAKTEKLVPFSAEVYSSRI